MRLANDEGMLPVKSLKPRDNAVSCVSIDKDDGIVPVNSLTAIPK